MQLTGKMLDVLVKDAHKKFDMEDRLFSLSQQTEINRIVESIIENLSEEALQELYGGAEKDIEQLFDIIYKETTRVLYGTQGIVNDSTFQYLSKLKQNIEETFRVENLNYFITSVLENFEIEWFHLEWGQLVMKHKKICVLACRGGGKSYYFSHAVPLWKMYRYKPRNILGKTSMDSMECEEGFIMTNENDLAKDLLEKVKNTIEDNEALRERLYPGSSKEEGRWRAEEIRCKNGTKLRTRTFGSAFRGRHPGYIVVDDLLKDNVLYSETQRRRTTDYFHAVIMNAVNAMYGQVIVVGTPFHQNDMYGDIRQKKNWIFVEYPAIFPNGQILSKRLPYHILMEKRESEGSLIFSREMLVRPIVSESTIFPFSILKRSFIGMQDICLVKNRDAYGIKFDRVVVGCDFAMSSSVGADYSVFSVWGISDLEDMYLMYIWRQKGASYMQQIAQLKNININFNPDVIVAEANVFQQIFVEDSSQQGLPIFPHVTGKDKHDLRRGWPGLAILFERGKIKLPRGDQYSIDVTDLICSEFSSVAYTDKGLESVGQHDDTCSSTWHAFLGKDKILGKLGISFVEL